MIFKDRQETYHYINICDGEVRRAVDLVVKKLKLLEAICGAIRMQQQVPSMSPAVMGSL